MRIIQVITVILFSLLIVQPATAIASVEGESVILSDAPPRLDLMTGPYIHHLQYEVIPQDDEQVLALLNNEIDVISNPIDISFRNQLVDDPNVQLEKAIRNGYGYLTINCDKYPLSLTSFRRAFAFAFNKTQVVEEVWEGLAVCQDSLVPQVNLLSIEGNLPYNYYDANIARANEILDNAGFDDIDSDGYREAPDGSDFDIRIECANSANTAIEIGQIAADALTAVGISAVSQPTDFYEYLNRLYFHGDYDIVFLGSSYNNFRLDWMAYEFWSENADEPYWNFPNFRNSTYDSWRNQILHSTHLEGEGGVLEAVEEMQKIWIYESPMVIAYENVLLFAHRTDRFTGWVSDVSYGIGSLWTNMKVRLNDSQGGPLGGTLRVGVQSSGLSLPIRFNLYESLLMQQPDGFPKPWIAESYIIETNEDDESIPNGRTKFTFNIVNNQTWSDGTPLTAEDVAFSLNYYRNNPGNPQRVILGELNSVYAPTSTQVIVEMSSESYWHLFILGNAPIMPKHIGSSMSGIVTSGPFFVNGSSYYNLTTYPDHFKYNSLNVPLYEDDGIAPEIFSPDDLVYALDSIGNQLNWTIRDPTPGNYTIQKDGITVIEEDWNTTELVITLNVDGLGLGTFNYTIFAIDYFGHTSRDSVFVMVELDIIIVVSFGGIAGVAVIVIIAGAMMRNRSRIEYYEYS